MTENTDAGVSSRDSILGKIRDRIGASDDVSPGAIPQPPAPEYEVNFSDDKVASFISRLEAVHGTVSRVSDLEEVPKTVNSYLAELDPAKAVNAIVVSTNPLLADLDWMPLQVEARAADRKDRVSVTLAFAGIAETGTVAMVSGAQSPVTPSFLPEVNIVVLLESTMLSTLEELWPKVEQQPRVINLITGPSKTGDIEQTIVYGAHGPRQFHVILVDEA